MWKRRGEGIQDRKLSDKPLPSLHGASTQGESHLLKAADILCGCPREDSEIC